MLVGLLDERVQLLRQECCAVVGRQKDGDMVAAGRTNTRPVLCLYGRLGSQRATPGSSICFLQSNPLVRGSALDSRRSSDKVAGLVLGGSILSIRSGK
ncbi:hypothetical protein D3C76_1489530 [compost metagenome]